MPTTNIQTHNVQGEVKEGLLDVEKNITTVGNGLRLVSEIPPPDSVKFEAFVRMLGLSPLPT